MEKHYISGNSNVLKQTLRILRHRAKKQGKVLQYITIKERSGYLLFVEPNGLFISSTIKTGGVNETA